MLLLQIDSDTGSSSGSGVALGARLAPWALCEDTGLSSCYQDSITIVSRRMYAVVCMSLSHLRMLSNAAEWSEALPCEHAPFTTLPCTDCDSVSETMCGLLM